MDSTISSKNSNARMTSEEMINKSTEWTLGCDNALLNRLKDFSNSLVSQAEGITRDCDSLSNEVNLLQSRVESVTNEFLMLANTQYVENRVEEFEERTNQNIIGNKSQESRVKSKAEKEAELIGRMKEAIQIGLKTNSDHHQDKEDVTGKHQEFKIKRSHIIGTPKFFSSKFCGLIDEDKLIKFANSVSSEQISENSVNLNVKSKLPLPNSVQGNNYDSEHPQAEGFGSSNLTFRKEGSLSSDDFPYGKTPVSTSFSSNSTRGHTEIAQVPTNAGSSKELNTSSTLVSDLNNALRSRLPPSQIESDDSDDDFKPPATGQGRKLFAEPEDDDDSFFGSSAFNPTNRYIDNDEDDFFDPLPKLATNSSSKSLANRDNHTVPPISNSAQEIEKKFESPGPAPEIQEDPKSIAHTNSINRTRPQSNPAQDFSAVIHQIKSESKGKSSQEFQAKPPGAPSNHKSPELDSIVPTGVISTSTKNIRKPEPYQPSPQIGRIETIPKSQTKDSQDFRKPAVSVTVVGRPSHKEREITKPKVKHSIFDDSDSDDIFSSASSSSSKLKDSKSQNKDNLFTASSRSLSSVGGGSSLFGGDEAEDNFREKEYKGSSNDSLPNRTTNAVFSENNKAPKVQTISKVKVKHSIFDESDSDDDLFSSKSSKVIEKKKPHKSLFQAQSQKHSKPVSISGSTLFNEDLASDDIFTTKTFEKVNNFSSTPGNSKNEKLEKEDIKTNSSTFGIPNPVSVSSEITITNELQVKQTEKDIIDSRNRGERDWNNQIFEPIKGRVERLHSHDDKSTSSEEKVLVSKEKLKPITQSRSFVKNAALSLNINPLALKPGAKPPSATTPALEESNDSAARVVAQTFTQVEPTSYTLDDSVQSENAPIQYSKEPFGRTEQKNEQSDETQPTNPETYGINERDNWNEKSKSDLASNEGEIIAEGVLFPNESASRISSSKTVIAPQESDQPEDKPVQTKISVFDESDSDGDLFTSSLVGSINSKIAKTREIKVKSSLISRPSVEKNTPPSLPIIKSVFPDNNSENFFAEPVLTNTTIIKNTATQADKSVMPSVFQNVPPPYEPKIKSKSVKVKHSIFNESDSDDDLFTSKVTKQSTVEQKKSLYKKDTPGSSLFVDDTEDDMFLFNSRKTSELKTQLIESAVYEPKAVVPQDCSNLPTVDSKISGDNLKEANEYDGDSKGNVSVGNDTAGMKTESDGRSLPGMTNVKSLGFSLNINTSALNPGSKPPTPAVDEMPCSFDELPSGQENLLTGVAKNRVKIKKSRRLPTRKPKGEEIEDPIFGILPSDVDMVYSTDQTEDISSSGSD